MDLDLEKLLSERQKTHGNFRINAKVMMTMLDAVEWGLAENNAYPSDVSRAALTHICSKVSRIAGSKDSWRVREHWEDIMGYCQLVLKELAREDASPLAEEAKTCLKSG